MNGKKVAIIGGGVAGLTVAYRLSKRGFQVAVFEKGDKVGGLASTFNWNGVKVERYYHFICKPDRAYLEMIDELGLTLKLRWKYTRMGYFYEGEFYDFDSPFALLRFKPLPINSRLRFGIHAFRSRLSSGWKHLDELTAKEWLIKNEGVVPYEVIWKPLLELKFGDKADEISAAWIWARINRVANSREGIMMKEKLSHLEGGTQTLIDELVKRIQENGGKIFVNTPVQEISIENGKVKGISVDKEVISFDIVTSTVAAPLFVRLARGLPEEYVLQLSKIEYYGVLCILVIAKRQLTGNFWLNVHDKRISFPGIIEYTNLNPMPELSGNHILYVPYYMSTSDARFSLDDEEIVKNFVAELSIIDSSFIESIKDVKIFRDEYAQPVFGAAYFRHFGDLFAPRTPIKGLFRTDMSSVYPDDRSIVNAIDKGNQVAGVITNACDINQFT